MNLKAFQEATNSYIHRIRTSTWCEEGDKNCNASRMEDRLLQMFGDIFKGQTLDILARAPEVSDAMKQYMLIENAEEVERLRQASMNPSFSSEVGVNVDCEKLKEAAVAGTGSAGSTSQSGGQQQDILTPPSKTSPTACGLDSTTVIKDANSVTWRFDGSEWIPTSVELSLISEDALSGIASNVIINTTYSGAVPVLSSIPVIKLDAPIVSKHTDPKNWVKAQCSTVKTQTFGGAGGRTFAPVEPSTIQLRTGNIVDAIIVNDIGRGGAGGGIGGVLKLKPDEYINRVAVRAGKYVDRIEFYTNQGQELSGGGFGGCPSVLENVRVLKLGGKSGKYLDRLVVEYCVEE